jgi:antitoxin CptB
MSETPASSDKTEYNRLWWHSRRGMLELDNLLIPFVEQAYQDLGADDRARYKKLLSCEDNDMFEWFMQRNRPEDPDLQRIVDLILNRVQPD